MLGLFTTFPSSLSCPALPADKSSSSNPHLSSMLQYHKALLACQVVQHLPTPATTTTLLHIRVVHVLCGRRRPAAVNKVIEHQEEVPWSWVSQVGL